MEDRDGDDAFIDQQIESPDQSCIRPVAVSQIEIPSVVQISTINEWQDPDYPAPQGGRLSRYRRCRHIVAPDSVRRELTARTSGSSTVHCDRQLPQVIQALCAPSRLPRRLNSRQNEGHQPRNDGVVRKSVRAGPEITVSEQ